MPFSVSRVASLPGRRWSRQEHARCSCDYRFHRFYISAQWFWYIQGRGCTRTVFLKCVSKDAHLGAPKLSREVCISFIQHDAQCHLFLGPNNN
jgi:hypothetical protein